MKKFAKLVAVFAALMLAWVCFVACSNGDDDSGSNSASLQALQGLWVTGTYGFYIEGNLAYYAEQSDGKWYYDPEDPFPVSELKPSLNGELLTVTLDSSEEGQDFVPEQVVLLKSTKKPIPIDYED